MFSGLAGLVLGMRMAQQSPLDSHFGSVGTNPLAADANAEKAKVEKERDELREAFDILEAQLGTGTRQYDSEHQ